MHCDKSVHLSHNINQSCDTRYRAVALNSITPISTGRYRINLHTSKHYITANCQESRCLSPTYDPRARWKGTDDRNRYVMAVLYRGTSHVFMCARVWCQTGSGSGGVGSDQANNVIVPILMILSKSCHVTHFGRDWRLIFLLHVSNDAYLLDNSFVYLRCIILSM